MSRERRGASPWRAVAIRAALAVLLVAAVVAGRALAATGRATAGVAGVLAGAAATPSPGPMAAAAPSQATAAQPSPSARQQPREPMGCERCHGELELLRQQAGSLTRAEQFLVPHALVAGSAHGDMSCAECHTGFATYPHNTRATRTSTCVSCHAPADSAWRRGSHAAADDPVTCVQCHGSHDTRPADSLRTRHGAGQANAPCVSCHQSERLERHGPHADSVSCAGCHAPHDTRPADDPQSWMAPANQLQTCGACHDSVSTRWQSDIHGDADLRARHLAGREPAADVVSCTSCHFGHRMFAVADTAFAVESVLRCARCHEKAASTFFGSYHGKATALGSSVSASCSHCHGAHDILPDSMSASRVAQANLVDTCGGCHPYARAAFVRYDAHPDPFNRARNPWIFYSFWLMNGLLIFVLVVFGAHTVLWWIKILQERRHGHHHGSGGAA